MGNLVKRAFVSPRVSKQLFLTAVAFKNGKRGHDDSENRVGIKASPKTRLCKTLVTRPASCLSHCNKTPHTAYSSA